MTEKDIENIWFFIVFYVTLIGTVFENLNYNKIGGDIIVYGLASALALIIAIAVLFVISATETPENLKLGVCWAIFSIFIGFAGISRFTNVYMGSDLYLIFSCSMVYVTYVYVRIIND